MNPDELLTVDLDELERGVLVAALNQWGGPARPTEELAVAIGFEGLADLHRQRPRLAAAIADGEPMSGFDWARILLATEIVFMSSLVGAAFDWEFTTGIGEEAGFKLIRSVQSKTVGQLRPLVGTHLGTRPST